MRYSSLKALKFSGRLAGITNDVPVGPVHVQIILSDLCNQACHFCAYRDPGYTSSILFHVEGNYNPNRKLPFEKVVEILDDCKEMGVKAIQYTGGGEPTVHPQFDKVIEETLSRGFKWGLVTNGVIQKWDFSSASWVRVSLDAANPETYAKIRSVPESHFAQALKSIERYKCGVGFVVTPENWREIYDCAKLVKKLGASSLRIGAQFSEEGEHLFDGFRKEAAGLAKLSQDLSSDSFEVVNRFTEKMEDLHQENPDYQRCGYQYFTTYIGADQNMYRCCVYAYNPRGLIGSIKGRRFKDAWKEAHASFNSFDARGCERCQFNKINRNINEVLEWDESSAFV